MKPNFSFATLVLAVCLASCSADDPQRTSISESEALNQWFQQQFEIELEFSPLQKTRLGYLDDLDAYSRWDDASDAAREAALERSRQRLHHLRTGVDFEALDAAAKTSWRFAEYIETTQLKQAEFRDHAYVFNHLSGPHARLPATLIGLHRVDNLAHAEAWLARLDGLSDALWTYVERAERQAADGMLAPAFVYPIVIASIERYLRGAPFEDSEVDSPLLQDFRTKIEALDLAEDEQSALISRANNILVGSVGPGFRDLIDAVRRHETLAAGRVQGASALPQGEGYYNLQLQYFTTREDLDAATIHQIGVDEVARIQREMQAIMTQVGFEGSLQDFFAHLRDSPEFYYEDSAQGRADYLRDATRYIDQLMQVTDQWFGQLPRAGMEVRAVEDYRIESATGAFYEPGSLDGVRPGAYYVNLASMRDMPIYTMETLAYHEGAPGHHFQVALAREIENVPMFQKLTWYSAYGEGWALYTEYLGKEMGFFTDPYQDFGRLSYEIFRAARLVVDTGIHALGWTEEQAVAYMLENTPLPEGDIRDEVRRYFVWPGQAVSYKIGMITIMELRQRAMDALGDEFDIREFHDLVLLQGSVPLGLLEQLVDDWIAARTSFDER